MIVAHAQQIGKHCSEPALVAPQSPSSAQNLTTYIHVSKMRVMKNAILKRAEQQLMGGGYDKLNFATIARDLNTTRANLHYHFKNKETLAIEVTKQCGTRNCNEFNLI